MGLSSPRALCAKRLQASGVRDTGLPATTSFTSHPTSGTHHHLGDQEEGTCPPWPCCPAGAHDAQPPSSQAACTGRRQQHHPYSQCRTFPPAGSADDTLTTSAATWASSLTAGPGHMPALSSVSPSSAQRPPSYQTTKSPSGTGTAGELPRPFSELVSHPQADTVCTPMLTHACHHGLSTRLSTCAQSQQITMTSPGAVRQDSHNCP